MDGAEVLERAGRVEGLAELLASPVMPELKSPSVAVIV
jgi:hypothetical protein